MTLNNWFEKGLSKEAYMQGLDTHKDGFHHIKENFTIPSGDLNSLESIKDTRAIILAAEWCGHCMLDIAIFLNIAEATNIDTRFLIRDDNLSLMDQYLTNEKAYIPIIIFIDKAGNEIVKWGPWAPEINEFMNTLKANLPPRDSEQYEEAFQQLIQKVGSAFRSDEALWQYVYTDMKKSILSL